MYISLRHLKKTLRRLGCRRRPFQSDPDEVVDVVQQEIKGGGRLLGYRAMYQLKNIKSSQTCHYKGSCSAYFKGV